MHPVPRQAAALALPLALVLLAGCSDGSDDAESPASVAAAATGTAAGDDETYEDEYDSGTSDGAGGSTTTTTTADGRRETAISGFAFEGTITVAAGTEVVWTNLDGAGHTVSAREGAFDSGGTLEQGQSFSFTFDRAGRYDFYCQIHPSMTGTVVVQ